MSKAQPDLDPFVGELFHDVGNGDCLAVVAGREALPPASRHDGGLEDGTRGLYVINNREELAAVKGRSRARLRVVAVEGRLGVGHGVELRHGLLGSACVCLVREVAPGETVLGEEGRADAQRRAAGRGRVGRGRIARS